MLARIRPLALVAVATLLAGCFQVDSVLTVQPDGSGELVETLSGDGMMGLALLGVFGEREVGSDQSLRLGAGVTVRAVDRDAAPGRARLRTVYSVPDVSALRYSVQNAVDTETLVSKAMAGGGMGTFGDDTETPEPDSTAFTFAFAPARAGQPAELQVTAPEIEIDTPDAPGMNDSDQTPQETYEMALVMGGSVQMRFAVALDGTLAETDGGWAAGNRVALLDVDFGPFLEYAYAAGGFENETAFANLVSSGLAGGLDVPGYRSVGPGVTTIRFR